MANDPSCIALTLFRLNSGERDDGYDCYQNALAERINGILKTGFLRQRPTDLKEARKMVAESVAIYNGERPHLPLKYKMPDEVHQAF
jgi:transposase InsO family protein